MREAERHERETGQKLPPTLPGTIKERHDVLSPWDKSNPARIVYQLRGLAQALCPHRQPRMTGWRFSVVCFGAMLVALGRVHAADAVADALSARVTDLRAGREVRVEGERIASRKLIPDFYAQRGFRPAWTRPAQTKALLALVEQSSRHGLDPGDYHVAALRRLADAPAAASADAVAEAELLRTDALVRLAYHLYFGKANPRELYPDWNFTRSLGTIDPVQAVEEIVAADRLADAVERYAPHIEPYRQLREALARYRAIEVMDGWPELPSGPKLERGSEGPRVEILRKRLTATGDLRAVGAAAPAQLDEVLETAVRHFQARHGLEVDGVVGRQTLEAMNVTVAERIDQLRVNLDRLRWVAQDLVGDYLLVDVAGFSARLDLDGRLAWSSRAVVGRPYRKTPVFRATMEYVVLNPTWTIPPTILREDVLPKLAKDPGYLADHHMQLVDAQGHQVDASRVEWSRYPKEGFPYQIVQAPGSDNPLGRLKFLLPNRYSVYLHDTPTARLFSAPQRAFSSGCIRLEAPLALAELLLDDPVRWSAPAIDIALAAGTTRTLPVKKQVPVLFLYFTAEADADGTVHFRRDLYGRDPRVLAALRAPFRFSPVDERR
jgi:murein L,D-transpeptidase YcbB/YkuD